MSRNNTPEPLNLAPGGDRKGWAIILFILTTMVPPFEMWRAGWLQPDPQTKDFISQWRLVPWFAWLIVVLGSILSLMLYFPRRGYKRFAIIGGPFAGLGALSFLLLCLSKKTTVYHIELLIVLAIGAMPGIAIWLLLIWIKHKWQTLQQ